MLIRKYNVYIAIKQDVSSIYGFLFSALTQLLLLQQQYGGLEMDWQPCCRDAGM